MPEPKSKTKVPKGVTEIKQMRDYRHEPYFQAKLKKAEDFLAIHGLPSKRKIASTKKSSAVVAAKRVKSLRKD